MKHAKIDYKENALETAKHIVTNLILQNRNLKTNLRLKIGRQFTKDEADYAMKHLKTVLKRMH